MTEVSMREEEGLYELLVEGHSNYAENGNDIVCAGISTLAQSFALYCMEYAKIESLCIRSGYLSIRARECKEAYKMAEIGIKEMAKSYPENIFIKSC